MQSAQREAPPIEASPSGTHRAWALESIQRLQPDVVDPMMMGSSPSNPRITPRSSHSDPISQSWMPALASLPPNTPLPWLADGWLAEASEKAQRAAKSSGKRPALSEKQTAKTEPSFWKRLAAPANPAETTQNIRLGFWFRLQQSPRALMFIGLGTGIIGAILLLIALAASSANVSKKTGSDPVQPTAHKPAAPLRD